MGIAVDDRYCRAQGVNVERVDADDETTEDAHGVGVYAEQRGHHDQREHSRQDEELDGRDAKGRKRIDLLISLHRADLCGKGSARATGEDDRRHDRGHLARHRHGHEVRVVDVSAELP